MGKWMKTIVYLIVSAFLTHLIPSNSFFRNVDTMVHEFGHALVTLLLSGHVMDIELHGDHSGLTRSTVDRPWAMIPIALAGYMTAALFSWLLFSLYARGRQRTGLMLMTTVAIASLALFVRNGFGLSWLAVFIVVNVLATIWMGRRLGAAYYLLIAFLTLEESVFGSLSLVVYALQDPAQAGDATVLGQSSGVPPLAWACWFSLFSLWCAKQGVQAFAGRKRRPRRGTAGVQGNYNG